MNNPYDLHTWSKHYREEAHQEAQRRHLLERARAGREQHSGTRPRGSRLGERTVAAALRAALGAALTRPPKVWKPTKANERRRGHARRQRA
jgi:hypothetical protein